jgi:hypothetical protein
MSYPRDIWRYKNNVVNYENEWDVVRELCTNDFGFLVTVMPKHNFNNVPDAEPTGRQITDYSNMSLEEVYAIFERNRSVIRTKEKHYGL